MQTNDPDRFADLEAALRSDDPFETLRQIAIGRRRKKVPKQAVIEQFEAFRARLRAENRESDEDVVMDVLDLLLGWCGPHMAID